MSRLFLEMPKTCLTLFWKSWSIFHEGVTPPSNVRLWSAKFHRPDLDHFKPGEAHSLHEQYSPSNEIKQLFLLHLAIMYVLIAIMRWINIAMHGPCMEVSRNISDLDKQLYYPLIHFMDANESISIWPAGHAHPQKSGRPWLDLQANYNCA